MQYLFYNLSYQGAEKEPCGREMLKKGRAVARSTCKMPYHSILRIRVCHSSYPGAFVWISTTFLNQLMVILAKMLY